MCDGFSDCPGGEDEKKCTALIDDELEEDITESRINLVPMENLLKNHSITETIDDSHLEATESSILDTTLYVPSDDFQSERLIKNDKNDLFSKLIDREAARNRNAEKSKIDEAAVSSRETSSNVLRNDLTSGNNLLVRNNGTFPVANVYNKEIDNYNNKGYLSVRKNGVWRKLCYDTNGLNQERHARRITWSIEDLAKAACKAITYR